MPLASCGHSSKPHKGLTGLKAALRALELQTNTVVSLLTSRLTAGRQRHWALSEAASPCYAPHKPGWNHNILVFCIGQTAPWTPKGEGWAFSHQCHRLSSPFHGKTPINQGEPLPPCSLQKRPQEECPGWKTSLSFSCSRRTLQLLSEWSNSKNMLLLFLSEYNFLQADNHVSKYCIFLGEAGEIASR